MPLRPPDTHRHTLPWHVPSQATTVSLLALMLLSSACGQPAASPSRQPHEGSSEPASQNRAPDTSLSVPQEALVNRPDAIALPGQVEVPGYTGGIIQIDAFPAGTDTIGRGPLTTLRLSKPGPFKLLLPPNVPVLEIRAQLDLKSDGPDWRDPFVAYAGNPLRLDTRPAELKLSIDLKNTLPPPPGQGDNTDRPPWETEGSAGAPSGSGPSSAEPAGTKAPAAPVPSSEAK